jgi:hypothetical protein
VIRPNGTRIRYVYDHADALVLTEIEGGDATHRQVVIEGLWLRDPVVADHHDGRAHRGGDRRHRRR